MNNRLDLTIDQIYALSTEGREDLLMGLEKVYNTSPLGPLASNLVNTVYGINHRQTQLALPFNKDAYGLTFFTRPRMNLTRDNVRMVRQMIPLLNSEPRSIQRIIRVLLDPLLALGSDPTGRVYSPYVDDLNVFIPLLTNLCLSVSGWNDFGVDSHVTPEGHFREAHSMVDSSIEVRNSFELSVGFRNIPNNPVTLLFYFWLFYASKVFEGELIPYGSSLYELEIDYNTKITRLVLDPTKRYVQHIFSTIAYPISVPVGNIGNFDSSQPFNDANDNVNIRFQCIGMEYNDPIQIKEFNDSVCALNPGMDDESRDSLYIQIPYQILSFFNMRGYPRINPSDSELQWYVSYSLFRSYAGQLAQAASLNGMKDLSFLSYINPNQNGSYHAALNTLNNTPMQSLNGGIIRNALNGTSSIDEMNTISQALNTGGINGQ